MSSWLDGKKAPDGTRIIRHGEGQTQLGITPNTQGFHGAREAAYKQIFGEALSVSHELLPLIPHIDVYTFQRKRGDQAEYSLVTGGMSDLEMILPEHAGDDVPRRVELIFYCAEPSEEYIEILRWLAHFPHNTKSWLGHGHTMPNGNPPSPFWGSATLDTILFSPPIVKSDQTLPELLQLDGQAVHFLWVIPITTEECNLKLNKGFGAIMDLFGKNRHPHIFNPTRKGYV
jgi:hypothetical protein